MISQLNPTGTHGALQSGKSTSLDATKFPAGQAPTLLTAWNDGANTTLYVMLTSPSTPNNATIWAYTVDSKGFNGPTPSSISVSQRVVSMAATARQLFFLEADGSVWNSAISADHKVANVAPVLVNQPIATPLAADPQKFTASTSVPAASAITPKGNIQLSVPSSQNAPALLSTASVTGADGSPQDHLLIGDPANHRILDLTSPATAGGPGGAGQSLLLTLVQQYASLSYFTSIKGLTADASATITILGQHPSSNEDLVVINIGSQKSCAS
jgi:hypothetical protein